MPVGHFLFIPISAGHFSLAPFTPSHMTSPPETNPAVPSGGHPTAWVVRHPQNLLTYLLSGPAA